MDRQLFHKECDGGSIPPVTTKYIMKLQALIENELTAADVRKVARRNLIVMVDWENRWEDEDRETHGFRPSETYIITDVPRISRAKFKQLYQTSFDKPFGQWGDFADEGRLADYVEMWPLIFTVKPTVENDWLETSHKKGYNKVVGRLKWKEFVTKMVTEHPPQSNT